MASVCRPSTIAPAGTNPCAASIGPSASSRLKVSPGRISWPLRMPAALAMFCVLRGSLVRGVENSLTTCAMPSASSAAVDSAGSVSTSSAAAVRSAVVTACATAPASASGSSVVPGCPATMTGAPFWNANEASAARVSRLVVRASTASTSSAPSICRASSPSCGTNDAADVLTSAASFVPQDGELALQMDGALLVEAVLARTTNLLTLAADASFAFQNGAPVIVAGQPGTTLDPDALAGAPFW